MSRGALVATVCVVAAVLVAGGLALASRLRHGLTSTGSALTVYGPQANSTIGYPHVDVGKTYRFSFPVPQNKLGRPVVLTGASVVTVPAGASVVGYELYSMKEVGGYPLSYDVTNTANTVHLLTNKNYIDSRPSIAPHSDSDYWAMVAVKVTGPVVDQLSGCVYRYSVGSRHYQQEFPCEFQLGGIVH